MRHTLRRSLPLLLAFALLLTLAPAARAAQTEGTCGENAVWRFDASGGALTISGAGPMADYTDASPAPWSAWRAQIRSVTVAGTVSRVGDRAFFDCRDLETAAFSDGVTELGRFAFTNCIALRELALPDSVRSLGADAFALCFALTRAALGEQLRDLPAGAFAGCCALTELVLPAGLETVGDEALRDCAALRTVYYGGTQADWAAVRVGAENAALTRAQWHYQSDGWTNPFTDVAEGRWSYPYIKTLCQAGVVNGMTATTFQPAGRVTRAQFVKMLACAAGADVSGAGDAGFADVRPGAWYAPYVAWAVQSGVTTGVTATAFQPEGLISREQMAAMLYRWTQRSGIALPETQAPMAFTDGARISAYAREAVAAMQRAGILNGYAEAAGYSFRPANSATREEAAKILCLFYELLP